VRLSNKLRFAKIQEMPSQLSRVRLTSRL
jgi:hypothetical protein